MKSIFLPSLDTGDTAKVSSVQGMRIGAKRLADMGFVRGAELEMVKSGIPCIVRIGGHCVGLGQQYQQSIELSKL